MKKNILFVILEGFADWEAAYLSSAIRTFNANEYDVKTVSLEKNAVESIGGFGLFQIMISMICQRIMKLSSSSADLMEGGISAADPAPGRKMFS